VEVSASQIAAPAAGESCKRTLSLPHSVDVTQDDRDNAGGGDCCFDDNACGGEGSLDDNPDDHTGST
jgi:hypothetical protein